MTPGLYKQNVQISVSTYIAMHASKYIGIKNIFQMITVSCVTLHQLMGLFMTAFATQMTLF